ncbi:MAG TPA: hypothetical protein GX708_09765 [Gallicola sp.]|jgi:hypothetical protein|nr:hypothetical protein [Gallicola sp.]
MIKDISNRLLEITQNEQKRKFIYASVEYIEYINTLDKSIDEKSLLRLNSLASNVLKINIFIEEMYLLRSFNYYVKELRDLLLKERKRELKLNRTIKILSYSLMNVFYSMHSDFRRNYSKPKIVLFEASPADLSEITSGEEIKKIYEILSKDSSKYFPIVRFSTNRKIFNETIKSISINAIHFAGHSQTDGIMLLSYDWKSEILSPQDFISFFEYTTQNISLVYLNSCSSNVFASKIKKYKRTAFKFHKLISFAGEIYDSQALRFSVEFYKNYSIVFPPILHKILLSTKTEMSLLKDLHMQKLIRKLTYSKR